MKMIPNECYIIQYSLHDAEFGDKTYTYENVYLTEESANIAKQSLIEIYKKDLFTTIRYINVYKRNLYE